MSLARDLVRCLSTMDCLYPRDLPQPARKKKNGAMERPLKDATTADLWKTLFALIVELSLRSGLVTEEELIPALVTPPGNEIARPRVSSHDNASQVGMEEGTDHELGEESAKEEDPLVEFAQEPHAETESGANAGDTVQPESNDFHTSASQNTAVVNSVATINEQGASSHRDPSQEDESALAPRASHHSYPPEYNPL